MPVFERIDLLLSSKGISASKMMSDLGFSNSTYTTWKKRGTSPSGDDLSKIADYFHVSVDYLLDRSTPSNSSAQNDPQETRLLSLFRALNPAGQDYILKQAVFASQQVDYKQESSAAKDA